MVIRYPAVAGMFYPSDPHELIELIEYCYLHELGPGSLPTGGVFRKPIGLVCPMQDIYTLVLLQPTPIRPYPPE